MQFDLADMRLFAGIAETNSITGGAERMGVSLSSASARLRNLEQQLGVALLVRSHPGVILTPAGQAYLQHALNVTRELEHLCVDMREYRNGAKGHVRLMANGEALAELRPAVLSAYIALHPETRLDLSESLSPDIVLAVSDGRADIGIVSGDVRTEGLDSLPYREDKLVLVTAPKHPLAEREQAKYAEILEYDCVSLADVGAFQGWLPKCLAGHGAKVRIRVGCAATACRLIAAGAGIGILPESAARRHAATTALRLIRLQDEWAVRKSHICVRSLSLLPTFAKELVDLLLEDARQH